MRSVGLVLAAVALVAASAGCTDRTGGNDPTVTPSASSPSAGPVGTSPAAAGPDGMNVRYLDADGRVKELKVEDLRR